MHSRIQTIIFDMGGVFYRVAPQKTVDALNKLTRSAANAPEISYSFASKFLPLEAYEQGRISTEEFREIVRRDCRLVADDDAFDAAWNALMIGVYEDNVRLLPKLKQRFSLILLSNNNPIHYSTLEEQCGEIFEFFDALYFSHFIGLTKPDSSLYRKVLADHNLKAEESLFIDDSKVNTDGARAVGMKVLCLSKPEVLKAELEQIVGIEL